MLNNTRVYTYDNAGNILTCAVYAYTAEGTTPTNPQSTYTYGYSSSKWGDVMSSFGGGNITYDEIGNPLSYYNGTRYTFSWTGTDLTGAVKSGTTYSFTYNDEGIRTSKTKNGVTTTYYLSGTQVIAEETNGNLTVYLYDAEGLPLGMRYHGTTYAETRWDTYWYEKNIFGDVVAAYDNTGTVLVRYKYDAYGKPTITYYNGGASTAVAKNPFMFRGYYYDSDLQLYYLNARYYDANTGRFISPDRIDVVCATPGALTDKNLYAYCDNNPVMRVDYDGEYWHIVIGVAAGALIGGISSIVGQAVSGQKINWAEVAVSAASGALTGAITAACPSMGAVATGVVHGAVGAGTHVATELVNGRTPTVAGTLSAGVISGVLAGGAKAIGNNLTTTKLYRSVNAVEAKNFLSTGKLSAGAGQMEGKFFATTRSHAKIWGSKLGSDNIISIRVPKSALSHSSVEYFSRLDAIGPAYYFSDLSYLNSVLR